MATPNRWPAIRAGLIAFAIFLGLVDGCPLPKKMDVLAWNRDIVETIRPVQWTVLRPFQLVPRTFRFTQRWALMQAANPIRMRWVVEGRLASGAWVILFRPADPAHAAFAEVFEHPRMFGAWNPTDKPTPVYPQFVRWATKWVLDQRPDLTAVRTGYERVLLDDGALTATGLFSSRMTLERRR